jgi:hypothetical protein
LKSLRVAATPCRKAEHPPRLEAGRLQSPETVLSDPKSPYHHPPGPFNIFFHKRFRLKTLFVKRILSYERNLMPHFPDFEPETKHDRNRYGAP